ncbi:Uncharacterised protein [Mycobacteroides abscessus subsp. massiliense]|nr:Uncharacterised protein [Mycobacteroides abscessus subsp. massiliense]
MRFLAHLTPGGAAAPGFFDGPHGMRNCRFQQDQVRAGRICPRADQHVRVGPAGNGHPLVRLVTILIPPRIEVGAAPAEAGEWRRRTLLHDLETGGAH